MSKKTPEIRFKGFSDDWEQRKLGEHSQIQTGGTPKTKIKEFWEPKEIPWMSSGEINKKRLFTTDNQISKLGLNSSSAKWVKEKSVLIALAGQGKTRGTVAINEIPLTTNQSIAAIVPTNILDSEFLYQNLENRYEELRLISSGDGSRGGLNKKIISDIKIEVPSINEQNKLGTFFKHLDDTIALHQREIDLLKQSKKGLLHQMLPKNGESIPKFRLSDFEKSWKKTRLNKLVQYRSSKYSSNQFNGNEKRGAFPVFDANNTIAWIETYDEEKNYLSIIKDGAGVGRIVKRPGKSSVIATMGYLTTEEQNIDFIHVILQTVHFTKFIVGSTIPHIYFKDYGNLKIRIPSLKEQQKIGNLFKQLDIKITHHEEKLIALNQIKKSYLQKMFV